MAKVPNEPASFGSRLEISIVLRVRGAIETLRQAIDKPLESKNKIVTKVDDVSDSSKREGMDVSSKKVFREEELRQTKRSLTTAFDAEGKITRG